MDLLVALYAYDPSDPVTCARLDALPTVERLRVVREGIALKMEKDEKDLQAGVVAEELHILSNGYWIEAYLYLWTCPETGHTFVTHTTDVGRVKAALNAKRALGSALMTDEKLNAAIEVAEYLNRS